MKSIPTSCALLATEMDETGIHCIVGYGSAGSGLARIGMLGLLACGIRGIGMRATTMNTMASRGTRDHDRRRSLRLGRLPLHPGPRLRRHAGQGALGAFLAVRDGNIPGRIVFGGRTYSRTFGNMETITGVTMFALAEPY